MFHSNDDRKLYLKLLDQQADRHNVRVLGWCLMTNHVHLILIPEDAASLGMALGQAHSQYALAMNRRRETVGHLWQNRFHSCALQGSHLFRALRYVELNPVRAGLARSGWEWPWSSALAHVHGIDDPLMSWDWQAWFRGWDYAGWKEGLAPGVSPEEVQAIRRSTWTGEPFGTGEFVADLERQTGRKLRVGGRGRPKKLAKAAAATAGPPASYFGQNSVL